MALAFNAAADTIKGFLAGARPHAADRPTVSDDTELLTRLNDKLKKAKDNRRQYEREWMTNLAYLRGQQWLQWDKVRQTLYLPPAPPWRVRSTTNLIQPIYRTILGKISGSVSQAKVRAANDTPDAQQDARAQDELREYLWVKCDSEETSLEALKWAIIAGTGIHHPCWDKSLGDAVIQPDTTLVDSIDAMGQPTQVEQPNPDAGQPVREPGVGGQPDPSGNAVHQGEIDHIAVSPFEFFPEPLAQKIEDMEHVFYVKVRPASYVNRKFGTDLEDETIPVDEYTVNNNEDASSVAKGLMLHEYWERPNAVRPAGQYVVFLKDKILFKGDNPYRREPIPFIAVREATVPGRFWGRSIVSDLVPLQETYNKLTSQGAEIRNSIARPKWHVFRNALRPGQTISTAPAEVIVTDVVPGAPDGGKPTKIEGGDVPASFFQEAERIQRQFWEVAGLHDFSRGTQPGGKTFGGLNLLIEQDDTRAGILKRDHENAILKVEKAKLRLAKQFYIEPRTITIVGPDQSAEVKEFYAETIPDDVNVELVAAGQLPSSWAARQQYILELIKTPIVPGSIISDPRTAVKMLGLADVEGVFDKINRDIRQAQRENELMMAGQLPQAHEYDNHMVHGEEHDDVRKGEEYEAAVAANATIEQVFMQHVALHKGLIQAAMPTPQPIPQQAPHAHPAPPGPPSVPAAAPVV